MGRNDDTAILAGLRAYTVYTEVQGIDKVVFNLPLDIIILIHIDLIAGLLGVIWERGKYAVGVVIPRKACFKIRKQAQDVNFFLGSSFHTENRNNTEMGTNLRKCRTVKTGVVIGKGQNLDAFCRGSFRQSPGGKF
jgi:hypothetical protein